MKTLFLTFLVATVMVGAAVFARSAQEGYGVSLTNSPAYPLQIVSVSPQISQDGTAFEGAKVKLRNTGNVPCDAFAVSFIVTFSDAETHRASLQEDRVPFGYTKPGPADDKRIMPNQIYTAEATGLHVPSREPATVTGIRAHIDYIEMADGKTYGNDLDRVGEAFLMARWERIMERNRLLKIYETKGPQALVNELERK